MAEVIRDAARLTLTDGKVVDGGEGGVRQQSPGEWMGVVRSGGWPARDRLSRPGVWRQIVTWQMAAYCLAEDNGMRAANRPEKPDRQAVFVRDMEARRWAGDSMIKFDTSGRLIDGQNRLRAQVTARADVEYIVCSGATQLNTDTNSPRKFTDQLVIDGERRTSHLNSALTFWLYLTRPDLRRMRGDNGTVSIDMQSMSEKLDHLADMRAALPDLDEDIKAGVRLNGDSKRTTEGEYRGLAAMTPGIAAVLMAVTRQIDAESAEAFWAALSTPGGCGIPQVVAVREKFLQNAALSHVGGMAGTLWRAAWLAKAWNNYRDNTMQPLSWTPGGAKPEVFPVPH